MTCDWNEERKHQVQLVAGQTISGMTKTWTGDALKLSITQNTVDIFSAGLDYDTLKANDEARTEFDIVMQTHGIKPMKNRPGHNTFVEWLARRVATEGK